MAGSAAGLLEPRCCVHRVADEGYLSLKSANLSGHKRARMKARAKPGKVPVAAHRGRNAPLPTHPDTRTDSGSGGHSPVAC